MVLAICIFLGAQQKGLEVPRDYPLAAFSADSVRIWLNGGSQFRKLSVGEEIEVSRVQLPAYAITYSSIRMDTHQFNENLSIKFSKVAPLSEKLQNGSGVVLTRSGVRTFLSHGESFHMIGDTLSSLITPSGLKSVISEKAVLPGDSTLKWQSVKLVRK
jgi:hypothetical protein